MFLLNSSGVVEEAEAEHVSVPGQPLQVGVVEEAEASTPQTFRHPSCHHPYPSPSALAERAAQAQPQTALQDQTERLALSRPLAPT